jgi:SOS-response transcriptional repressor LexA
MEKITPPPKKPKRWSAPSALEKQISERVLALINKTGTNKNEIARKIGHHNFSKVLSGERGWRLEYVEAIAELFNVEFEELIGGPLPVPLLSRISPLGPFPHIEIIDTEKALSFVNFKGKGKTAMLQGLYALEIEDRSLMPVLAQGTIFICEKATGNVSSLIHDGDLVVCPDDTGKGRIGRIYREGERVRLEALNPLVSPIHLPLHKLKTCDRIIHIEPK